MNKFKYSILIIFLLLCSLLKIKAQTESLINKLSTFCQAITASELFAVSNTHSILYYIGL